MKIKPELETGLTLSGKAALDPRRYLEETPPRIIESRVPIPATVITTGTSGATTLATAASGEILRIDHLSVINVHSSSSDTFRVYIVDSGDTESNANNLIYWKSFTSRESAVVDQAVGVVLADGQKLIVSSLAVADAFVAVGTLTRFTQGR